MLAWKYSEDAAAWMQHRKQVQHCLFDHWLVLLLGHASQVAREGEEDSLDLGQGIHHFSRANPGMQNQSLRKRPMLLDDFLQLSKCTDTMHLHYRFME